MYTPYLLMKIMNFVIFWGIKETEMVPGVSFLF